VGDGIGRLFGVAENYPNLRSADNFLALQSQMEGTENRINVARMVFNDAVGDYNAAIRKMPGSLIAGMGDFKRKAYFKSDEGADKAIGVNF
jgi:LemA protein